MTELTVKPGTAREAFAEPRAPLWLRLTVWGGFAAIIIANMVPA